MTQAVPDTPPEAFSAFLRAHHHPPELSDLWTSYYAPVARQLEGWIRAQSGPVVVGVNGCQGSGKSTLCDVVAWILAEYSALRVAVLSIDDLYYSRAQRTQLAESVHPLLNTRGVPGTHDVSLGVDTLSALKRGKVPLRLPRFDKARDDRVPPQEWPLVRRPVNLVLFEGWCVGTQPQPEEALRHPVNSLEADLDADGRWREYVNTQLQTVYPELWHCLDYRIFLQAPGFECVERWRWQQEQQLAARSKGGLGVMTREQVLQFIAYYQRLTQHNLSTLPALSDVVVTLDEKQHVTRFLWQ